MTSRHEARNEIRNALTEMEEDSFNEKMELLKDLRLGLEDDFQCNCRACTQCVYCGLRLDNPLCCSNGEDSYEFDPFED